MRDRGMFAAAAALTTAGTATASRRSPVPHQAYRVTKTNADRDECLDKDTDTIPAQEAKMQLWACSDWTNRNQNWTFR